jgi:magnesium-transporting ATPase (P-type)
MTRRVAVRTTTFIILTLGIYGLGRFGLANNDPMIGSTMLFFTLALGSMIDIYPIKTRQPLTWQSIRGNHALNVGVCLAAAFVVAIAIIPGLRELFSVTTMPMLNWVIVGVAIFIPSCVLEIAKRIRLKRQDVPQMLMSSD